MSWIQYNTGALKFLIPILCLIWIPVAFQLLLFLKNVSFFKSAKDVPSILEHSFTQKEFEKLNEIGLKESVNVIIVSFLGAVFPTLYFLFQIYQPLWNLCTKIWNKVGVKLEIVRMLTFIIIFGLLKIFVPTTVISIAKSLMVEPEKAEISWSDYEGLILIQVILACIGYIILHLVRNIVEIPLLLLWILILYLKIETSYYVPGNLIKEIPDGELKDGLRNLTESVDFPFENLYYDPKANTNAYCTGIFGKYFIELQGKFISGYSGSENETAYFKVDEIVGAVAHELGHRYHQHTQTTIFLKVLEFGAIFVLVCILVKMKEIYEFAGFHPKKRDDNVEGGAEAEQDKDEDSPPVAIGLYVLMIDVVPLILLVLGFIHTPISRSYEYEADAYARELGYSESLQRSLIQLLKIIEQSVDEDSWFSYFNYDHPSLVDRIEKLQI